MAKIDDLAIEARRKYQRQWRAANKDKVKKHTADYWKRRAEKELKQQEQIG